MKNKKEALDVYSFLREHEPKNGEFVQVCIDCLEYVDIDDLHTHDGHTIVFSDASHSGIEEWISALEWVLEV